MGDTLRKQGIMYCGYADDTQPYLRFRPGNPFSPLQGITRMEAYYYSVGLLFRSAYWDFAV